MAICPSGDQMGFDFGESRLAEGSQVEKRCAFCKKTVLAPEWYVDRGIGLFFCTAECRKGWIDAAPSFEVTLEKRYRPRGANWEIQAGKARERDGFTCQVCRVNEEELERQLDVHHKIPFRSFKSNVEANKLENLISLCPSCHAKVEAQLQDELPLFRKSQ